MGLVRRLLPKDPPPFPLEGRPTPGFTCRLFGTVLVCVRIAQGNFSSPIGKEMMEEGRSGKLLISYQQLVFDRFMLLLSLGC